jgi:hypothetical protein
MAKKVTLEYLRRLISDATGLAVWGGISGTLSAQSDLSSALAAKVPTTRTLTIDGVTYDLSANRSWTTAGGAVSSVNGNTGAVVLDTDDISEGATNLYFTNARALAAAPAETATSMGALINAAGAATPNNGDFVATAESGGLLKKITWTNVKAFLKTYFDTLYPSGSGTSTGTNTGDQTSVSGNAGTATTLQTAREIDGISFDGSANIMVNNYLNILNEIGGTAKSIHWAGLPISNTGSSISNQRFDVVAVWLPNDATITGVNWIQVTAGDYTPNNYNGVGLYTYSGGTLTLVASSTDDGNIWKGTAQTYLSKAFSSPYNAAAGLYFIGALYCRSAAVTPPAIMSCSGTTPSVAVITEDFTNSTKLTGTVNSLTALPATQAMSGVTLKQSSGFWFQLY